MVIIGECCLLPAGHPNPNPNPNPAYSRQATRRLFAIEKAAEALKGDMDMKNRLRPIWAVPKASPPRLFDRHGPWMAIGLAISVPVIVFITWAIVAEAMSEAVDSQHGISEQLLCQAMHSNIQRLNRLLDQDGTLQGLNVGTPSYNTWLSLLSTTLFRRSNTVAEVMGSFAVLTNEGLYHPSSLFAAYPDGTVVSAELYSSANRTVQGLTYSTTTSMFATVHNPSNNLCEGIPYHTDVVSPWNRTTHILGTPCADLASTATQPWWYIAARDTTAGTYPRDITATTGTISNGKLGVTLSRRDASGVLYGMEIDMRHAGLLMTASPTADSYLLQSNGSLYSTMNAAAKGVDLTNGGSSPGTYGGDMAMSAAQLPSDLYSKLSGSGSGNVKVATCAGSLPIYKVFTPGWTEVLAGEPMVMAARVDIGPVQARLSTPQSPAFYLHPPLHAPPHRTADAYPLTHMWPSWQASLVTAVPPERYNGWLTTAGQLWLYLGLFSFAISLWVAAQPIILYQDYVRQGKP